MSFSGENLAGPLSHRSAAHSASSHLSTRSHMPTLDGLRGIAILMVMLVHFFQKQLFEESPRFLQIVMGRLAAPGEFGVQLFFVLSGFLITGILLATRRESGSLLKFYARRALRIFPLYYAALVVVLLILPSFLPHDSGHDAVVANQSLLWLHLANWPITWVWDDAAAYKLGHFWSLAQEEHFYLVWPLLIYILPGRWLFGFTIAGLGACTTFRALALLPDSPVIFHWSTLSRCDGLFVGSLLAIAVAHPLAAQLLPSSRSLCRWLLFTGAAVLTIVVLPRAYSYLSLISIFRETFVVSFFLFVVLAAFRAVPGSAVYQVLCFRPLLVLGKYSYGIYVIHGILRPGFQRMFDMTSLRSDMGLPLLYQFLFYVFSIGASVCLAAISFHLLERPALSLKRFFEYGKQPVTTMARSGVAE